jgi:ketosteroid isomerase-like protein
VSAETVAIVEQFNQGVASNALRWDLLDPDIYVIDHDIPDAGSYRGHAGVAKWLDEDWGSAWESYNVESEELVDAGDVVLSVFTITARGKGSGVETRRRNATVNTVENGLVTRIEYYTTEEEARAAAGLPAHAEH